MAGKLPKCEGLITVPTGGWSISVQEFTPNAGPVTVTIPEDSYYLTTAGTGSRSLLDEVAYQLTNNATLAGTYYCTLDDDNDTSVGKVTLSEEGTVTTFSVTWTSTGLRDVLGYTETLSAASTYLSTDQALYLWLPNTGRNNVMAPEPASSSGRHLGARERDAWVTVATSGYIAAGSYNTRYVDTFEFQKLLGNKVWIEHESVANESLEQFYSDVIGECLPFRYYSTRDSNSVYWTQVIENPQEFKPRPDWPNWVGENSLWTVSYMMRGYPNS